VGETLNIYDNPSLCQSFVDAFVERLEGLGWSGFAESYRNADC
jgi:hypothetical protein